MLQNQKQQYQQTLESYLQSNKIYDLFEKLTTQLSLHQPENPLEFLIHQLQRPKSKHLFLVSMTLDAQKLANDIGYELVTIKGESSLAQFDAEYKPDVSQILLNFPLKLHDAQAITSAKIIPDLIIVVEETDEALVEAIK